MSPLIFRFRKIPLNFSVVKNRVLLKNICWAPWEKCQWPRTKRKEVALTAKKTLQHQVYFPMLQFMLEWTSSAVCAATRLDQHKIHLINCCCTQLLLVVQKWGANLSGLYTNFEISFPCKLENFHHSKKGFSFNF